jgi:hypothetical protein
MTEWDIASFSAEQFARYAGGGQLGRPKWADPEMQRKQDLQRERLREALGESVKLYVKALRELSPDTAARLQNLTEHALAGNPEAFRLWMAMYGELCEQALRTDG